MLFSMAFDLTAQEEQELNEHQKWVLAKTEAFYKASGVNISTQVALKNFRELLASNQLCEASFKPEINIYAEGKRIDENAAILKWDVTFEKGRGQYIIERRFNNQYGEFDSVGVIEATGFPVTFQSYSYHDVNDFPGITWYRLRRTGGTKEEIKLVSVKGYNSTLKVIPNPAPSSDIYIELTKFKMDNQTTLMITDSRGIPVHTSHKAFIGTTIYQLRNLRLAQGAYHIKVVNKYNTSSTTFVVQ